MNKIYIFNPFLKIIPLNKNYLSLYLPLTQDIYIITKSDYVVYSAGISKNSPFFVKNKDVKELISKKLLLDINTDFVNFFNNWKRKVCYNINTISILYLLVNSECNLRCKYCFVKHNFTGSCLTETQIISVLKLFKNQKSHKQKKIILYGGEPLLSKRKVKFILQNIRRILGNKVSISIITNGLLIDKTYLHLFNKYNVSIGLSLDGLTKISNENRVDKNGEEIHSELIKKYKYLLESIPISISCTITNSNLKHLKKFVTQLDSKITGFGFNLLINKKMAYSQKIIPILLDIEQILLNKGITDDRIYQRRILKLINKQIYLKDCGGYGNQLVVTPDGDIGPCHGFDWHHKIYFPYNINQISSKLNLSKSYIWQVWNKRMPINNPKCINCIALTLCGGGCAVNPTSGQDLNIYKLDKTHCAIYIKLITSIIKMVSLNCVTRKIE